jgi:UDP-N-acetylglucosamine 3-dehydrogenase
LANELEGENNRMTIASTQDQPRIGVIGCGGIGRTHLKTYAALGIAPSALADSFPGALQEAVGTYGGRGFSDYRELIASGEVDAVSVCTPPAFHREICITALQAGLAVLCEKPMAISLGDAEEMAQVAAETGNLLTLGFCHRFQPHIETLKDLIEAGELGTIRMFRNRFAGIMANAEQTWFSNPAIAGGGAMFDTGVHSVDLFRHLIGDPIRVEAVATTVKTAVGPKLEVEDSAIITMQTSDGALGVIEVSWRTAPGEWVVAVYGTAGTAVIDYDSEELRVNRTGGEGWQLVEVPAGNRFERELSHFLDCVQGKATPRITALDGVAANRMLDQAYRSAGLLG